MGVADTSIRAYQSILDNLGGRRFEVVSAIYELGECCNVEIASLLKMEINKVTPRVKELREAGVVVLAKKATGPAGRLVCYWRMATRQEWREFEEQRRLARAGVDAARKAHEKRQRVSSVSEAGRALAAHRYNKRNRQIANKQEMLF